MVAPLNINPSKNCQLFQLLFSRNNSRGYGKHSSGATHRVTWNGSFFVINSIQYLAWASAPKYLDFSYDLLDRPQIVWKAVDGVVYVYFYDASLAAFTTKTLSSTYDEPIIHNDYLLLGSNTIFVYLINGVPHYRLASDRYNVDYQLNSRQYQGIKGLGYVESANSICLLLGYPPIPQG